MTAALHKNPFRKSLASKLSIAPRDERNGRMIHEIVAMNLRGDKMVARDPYGSDWLLWVANGDGTWTYTYGWGPTALQTALRALHEAM